MGSASTTVLSGACYEKECEFRWLVAGSMAISDKVILKSAGRKQKENTMLL